MLIANRVIVLRANLKQRVNTLGTECLFRLALGELCWSETLLGPRGVVCRGQILLQLLRLLLWKLSGKWNLW